jgi:iron complex outermembrane receptor protein
VKTSTNGSRRHPHKRRRHGEVCAAAGCAIFLVGSGAALAADPPAGASDNEEIGEVVVTGLRKSIQDSINAKKEDSSIVEAVSAEDIGKLPDASIAEAIGRLPGIAAQRTNGRAQTLSIRGLGPDFTVTTFNGREQASTNDNRTVEFDQYPSELVNQVKIYKTPDAGMAYQGIAGTTDIQTVHPLAYSDRKLAFGYKREMNQQDANVPGLPDSGDRVNATYIDQFKDNTIGVALGVAYNKTPYQAQTREPWGYPELPSGDLIIAGDKDGVQSSYYQRTAFMGVVEFKPTDQLHMVLDAYHSDFKELQTIQRMEYGTVVWGGATLTNPGPVENDRVQSGTFSNVPFVVIENYNKDREASVDSIGLNTNFAFNENWSMNADLSWSNVDRHDIRLESTAGNGSGNDPAFLPQQDTIPFTTESNGITNFAPTLNYSDYGSVFLTDPGAWGGGLRRAGFVDKPDISDEIKAIRLSATRKFEGFFLNNVTVGANYADRTKAKEDFQSNLWLAGNVSHQVIPEQYRTGIANSSFFGSPYGIIGYDALAMYRDGLWQTVNTIDDPNANAFDRANNVAQTWQVNEKLTTVYVKLGIDTALGSLPLRGNIGVQSVTADQTSDLHLANGQVPAGSATIPVTIVSEGDKYTDILPSLNLALEFPHEMKLRLGAAITVARPRLDELGGGSSYTVTSDQGVPPNYNGQAYYWTRNGGGNPKLQPWKANTFDLSFEKYFSTKGYVSLAAYYKDLKTYIFNQSVVEDFSALPVPTVAAGDPTTYNTANANRAGVSTLKTNGSGGYVQGFEVTASIPFDLFAEPLEGFGIIASAAWNSSSIKINGDDTPVPGLSDKIFNTTLYYERYGFSARVSNRYRGKFLGEVPLFNATLSFNDVSAESLLDAQIGYNFETGTLKGLSISLSGTNLTDEPFVLSNTGDDPYNLIKYEKYGAVYALALSYSF